MFSWWTVRSWASSLMRINCAALMFLTSIAFTFTEEARGEVVLFQNEKIVSGESVAIQYGFKEGDVVASVFALPAGVGAVKIMMIETIWQVKPEVGGLHSVVDVNLYCASASPNLGVPVVTKKGAALTPGVKWIDVSSDNWIVRAGTPFAIGLEYSWTFGSFGEFSTHVVTDADGCQVGRNLAYEAATNTWYDPCVEFPAWPGDFAIRVVGEVYPSKAPFGDYNHDGAVDMVDFAEFQRCALLPGGTPSFECVQAFDCDRDGLVNANDLTEFMVCANGPGIPVDPSCGACWPTGFCQPTMTTGLPLQFKGGNPETLAPLVWLLIAIVIFGGGTIGYFLYGKDEVVAARNAWIGDYRCPFDGSLDSQRLKEAIVYLRDTLGASDPEAKNIGKYLSGLSGGATFPYWNCDRASLCLVAEGPNTKYNFYAINPVGTNMIFIDRRFLETEHTKEGLALLLYAEATHFLAVSGLAEKCTDEQKCQGRLDRFRARHQLESVLPKMRHGLSEGYSKPEE